MEQNVKICYLCLQLHPTLAIWPHFPKKKAQSAQSLRLIYFQQKLILRQNIFSELPKVQRTQHQHHHLKQPGIKSETKGQL